MTEQLYGSNSGCWKEQGYEDFADGTFGNGGQNLYVSRNGVLQRIRRFDLNRDGWIDLVFVNSQDMNERPPVSVFTDPTGEAVLTSLTSLGPYAGAIGDLNGDGYDDLVVANQCNGTHSDVTAFIYYGAPEGLSERYKIELPVPDARAAAIGDFNGDGRPDVAFITGSKLRIFYQDARGFAPAGFIDLDIEATHLAAADIDGDGYADLYVRMRNAPPRILWGGPNGISLEECTLLGGDDEGSDVTPSTTDWWINFGEGWAPKVLSVSDTTYLFRKVGDKAALYPVTTDRSVGEAVLLACPHCVAAAAGDINGNGLADLVIACRENRDNVESSFIYWGGSDGFSEDRRTPIATISARDVMIADLTNGGCGDVVVCQGRTDVMNTTESLIYHGRKEGVDPEPIRLKSHDATAVLAGRTSDHPLPQLVFINHTAGRVRGDVDAYIYWGGPDGFHPDRRQGLPNWAAPEAICADMNDNGWPDLMILNCSENAPHLDPGTFLYWGGPEGFSPERMLAIPTFRAHGGAVGDFRHTGYLDFIVGGFANAELLVYRGGPDGPDLENPQRIIMDPDLPDFRASRDFNWAAGQKGIEYREPRGIVTADFNNDGWLDIFVAQIYAPRSFIMWGGPEGFSMDRVTWLRVEGADRAQCADLTGNGYLDLVIGGFQSLTKKAKYDTSLYIYWGGPDGFREDRKAQLPAHAEGSISIADFNNDGILDIFISCYNGGRDRDLDSYIYWGMPGGHYSVENRSRLFGHSACGSIAADFNEDGWIDLAVAHHKTYGNHVGFSKVWWNGPDGFCEKRVTKLPTMGPHGMLQVDPGNIMDRGPEEYYISSAYELPDDSNVTGVEWEAEIQPKTWVKAQLRFAATQDALACAAWQGPDGSAETWFGPGDQAQRLHQSGRWVQYKLALGATNGGNSPRVTSVTVHYA